MNNAKKIVLGGMALALFMASGCVVEPRNDYYDRDHHRRFASQVVGGPHRIRMAK